MLLNDHCISEVFFVYLYSNYFINFEHLKTIQTKYPDEYNVLSVRFLSKIMA